MRVVLHIGRHKCGTSSLQQFLTEGREALLNSGFLYPRAGTGGKIAHHVLARELNPRLSPTSAASENLLNQIMLEKRDRKIHTIIFSSEALQNISDLARLRAALALLGARDVSVVCYFREQVDYAISAFRQFIHANSAMIGFQEYAKRFQDMGDFITKWSGVGHLMASWLDRERLQDGDVVADFCQRVKLPIAPGSRIERNPSIGGSLLYFKLIANKLNESFLNYNAISEIAGSESRWRNPFFLSDALVGSLRSGSTYNASLERLLGPVRRKSWEVFPPIPDHASSSDLIELLEQKYQFRFSSRAAPYLSGDQSLEWM